VAGIRAGKRLAQCRPELRWVQSTGRLGHALVFYRMDNEISQAAGRKKAGLPPLETVRIQGGGEIRMEVKIRMIPIGPLRGKPAC
jgi:hypothetical protein